MMAADFRSIPTRLRGLVLLAHPFPVTVVMAASLALLVAARGELPDGMVAARAAATLLGSQVCVAALNDLLDRQVDARNQPGKPIPAGLISPAEAGLVAVLSAGMALIGAAAFGPVSLCLVAAGTGIGIAYDLWLKRTPYSFAAYVVAFSILFTWIWLIQGTFTWKIAPVYPGGALGALAAHLANSYPDLERDRASGSRGLAVSLGPRGTLRTILAAYAVIDVGALMLAVLARSGLALALALITSAMGMLVGYTCRNAAHDMRSRLILFRLLAPCIGLIALGAVLALTRV